MNREAPTQFRNGRWWVACCIGPDSGRWGRFWWGWHVRGLSKLDRRVAVTMLAAA